MSPVRVVIALLAWAAAWPSLAQPDCASCHQQQVRKIAASVHAAAGCLKCHPGHDRQPHRAAAKPAHGGCHARVAGEHAASVHGQALKRGNEAAPACAVCHGDVHETVSARTADFRKALPDTCGMCHSGVAAQFKASVHGQAVGRGILGAAVCTDCHGEHSIQAPANSASSVHKSHVRETCAQCHDNVRLSRKFGLPSDRVVSFDSSFHGLAAKAGSQTVANCASCHGVHNILASSDAKSTTNAKNLPATCGRCHQGAGRRFALGPVHLWPGRTEPASVALVRRIYMVLIPVLIGLMLLHNLGDWLRKSWRARLAAKGGLRIYLPRPGSFRMYRFERLLHALLAVSFILLGLTGFQLKYPETWWSQPVAALERTWAARGLVHRGAAVVFLIAGLMHAVSLAASPRLRRHWKNLWPRYTDVGEAWKSLLYRLGLRAAKPRLAPYSFIEKAEYWAVVWGGVVMTASGVLLWADNLTLRWFPKEVLDLATSLHFYEAVLASLAIVAWHFYVVIFDPEVYPIDTSWLTGYSVRRHEEGEARGAGAGR